MLGVCAKANLKKDEPCCFLIAQTPSSSAGQEPSAKAEEVAADKSAEAR